MTIEERRKAKCFYYDHKRVSWDEMPLEARKQDYPYYFDEQGNDHYPVSQRPHKELQDMIWDSKVEREKERREREERERQERKSKREKKK